MDNTKSNLFTEIRTLGVSSPTALPYETIEVVVSPDAILDDYAQSFVAEMWRVEPKLAERVQLTTDEMVSYVRYLLTKRVQFVHQNCSDWRKLSVLWMPAFVQLALAMVGEVKLRDEGLRFIPVMDKESNLTLEEAVKISDKIETFYSKLQILNECFPRSTEGDVNVMTSICISGYVRAHVQNDMLLASYLSAFMNLKLKDELKYSILFRREYDAIETIKLSLVRERCIY